MRNVGFAVILRLVATATIEAMILVSR